MYVHTSLLTFTWFRPFLTWTTDCHSLSSDLSASSYKCNFDSSQLPKLLLNLYLAYKAALHLAPAHPSRLASCHSAPPATSNCSEISEMPHFSPPAIPLAYSTLPLPSPLRSFLLHPQIPFLYFKTQLSYPSPLSEATLMFSPLPQYTQTHTVNCLPLGPTALCTHCLIHVCLFLVPNTQWMISKCLFSFSKTLL